MSKNRDASKGDFERFMSIGEETFLDRNIVRGLFESFSGNRYLVIQSKGQLYAIVLRHTDWRVFSLMQLTDQCLDYGRWWGPAKIRLTHASVANRDIGIIGLENEFAYLNYVAKEKVIDQIPIGFAPDGPYNKRCFDGWELEAAGERSGQIYFPFFTYMPSGAHECGSLEIDVAPQSHELIDITLGFDDF